MKRLLTLCSLAFCLAPVAVAQDSAGEATSLFNGTDLSGWSGRSDLWSVEDGAIVGRTTDEKPIDNNTFLVWEGGKPGDFELIMEFKIESGNSGIQYRSEVIDAEKFILAGYQADIDFSNRYAGIVYSERTGRGILAERGEKVTFAADGEKTVERFADGTALGAGIHPGKWNEFRIVAKGNQLTQYINGTKVSEVIDRATDKALKSGVIGLQLHKGPAMVVKFKNMTLRPLDDSQ